MKFFWSFLFFLSFVLSAQAVQEIKMVVTDFGQVPFHMRSQTNDNLVSTGIVIDFLSAFQKAYPQYRIVIQGIPRPRQELALDKGTADMTYNSPLFVGDKAEGFLWSSPFIRSRDCVISLKNSHLEFHGPKDLFGKEVGIIRGYGYGDYDRLIKEGQIKGRAVTETTQLIQMLKNKRIDAFFGNSVVTSYEMKLLKEDPKQFHFSSKSLYEFDFMFQINKRHNDLKRDLDHFIQKAKESGLIDKLTQRYNS